MCKFSFKGGVIEVSDWLNPEVSWKFPIVIGVGAVWGVGWVSKVENCGVGLHIELLLIVA